MKRPLLADGSIVKDYTPLFIYFSKLTSKGLEVKDFIISNNDLKFLEEIVSRGALPLQDLINRLIEYFTPRVKDNIAKEAVSEYLGIEVTKDFAVHYISKILAGWLIEAGKTLGILNLKGK